MGFVPVDFGADLVHISGDEDSILKRELLDPMAEIIGFYFVLDDINTVEILISKARLLFYHFFKLINFSFSPWTSSRISGSSPFSAHHAVL